MQVINKVENNKQTQPARSRKCEIDKEKLDIINS